MPDADPETSLGRTRHCAPNTSASWRDSRAAQYHISAVFANGSQVRPIRLRKLTNWPPKPRCGIRTCDVCVVCPVLPMCASGLACPTPESIDCHGDVGGGTRSVRSRKMNGQIRHLVPAPGSRVHQAERRRKGATPSAMVRAALANIAIELETSMSNPRSTVSCA